MEWIKRFGVVVIASLLLLNGSVPARAAWAQSAQPMQDEPSAGQEVAAGFSNVFYVPGKVIVCAASGVLWVLTMGLTFGTLYDGAANLVKGGCGGKWIVKGEDIHSLSSATSEP